jgi:hypothetical protein
MPHITINNTIIKLKEDVDLDNKHVCLLLDEPYLLDTYYINVILKSDYCKSALMFRINSNPLYRRGEYKIKFKNKCVVKINYKNNKIYSFNILINDEEWCEF